MWYIDENKNQAINLNNVTYVDKISSKTIRFYFVTMAGLSRL